MPAYDVRVIGGHSHWPAENKRTRKPENENKKIAESQNPEAIEIKWLCENATDKCTGGNMEASKS